MTRKWRDHKRLVEVVGLVLIDEVHCVKEPMRGATLEVVVSRMKALSYECQTDLRFVTVSATIPKQTSTSRYTRTASPITNLAIDT
jgi:ATP-dependent DNA helicase HFM1/MER3